MASRFEGELLAYRIVREGLPPFDGAGAFRRGGRWSRPGRHIIHAAETYSLAVLENLVHFSLGELPPRLCVVQLRIPATVSREVLRADRLPGWQTSQPNPVSQDFGDGWYDRGRSAVLIVPSVVSPFEHNLLIHQAHPQIRSIKVGQSLPATMDERLLELLRGGIDRMSSMRSRMFRG